MRILPAVVLAGLLCVGAAHVARGQEEKSTPLPSHLPLGVEACFGRVYDAQHLKSHPRQRVTSFHIFRDFTPDPNWEMEQNTREEMIAVDGDNGYVNVTAFIRFRDRKSVFSNMLSCRRADGGKVFCGIDCDGGSFNLRPSGASSLLVENNGFVVVGGCGGNEEEQDRPEFVAPGADDKTFRLDKQPIAQCVALRQAQAPAWAKLGKPLRLRLDKARATCHARTYDAAHLRAHPQQNVRRIAVLNPAKEQPAKDDEPNYQFVFRVEMKDGQTFEGRGNCAPDRYAYICNPLNPGNDAHEFYLTRAGEAIMLRDRKGVLAESLGAEFGTDDRMFRLQLAPESACTF
jgi:hypothetical protein